MGANLYKGSTGPEVKKLQQRLNQVGGSALPKLVEDGIFGSKTQARVIEFQKSKGLVPDGVVGPQTKAALALAPGSGPAGGGAPVPPGGGGAGGGSAGGGSGDIVGTVVAATASAIATWKSTASFSGIMVNGPTASGGQVIGMHLGSIIAASVNSKLQGEDRRIGAAAAAAIGDCFAAWQGTVRVPGMPWYPTFAAIPSPVAPPTPNIPCPLAALQSSLGMITSPGTIQSKTSAAVGSSSRPDAASVIAQIASQVAMRFQIFAVSTMVRNIMGGGPVPTFAPPYVPVGPVIGGSANGFPGCFS